MHIAMLSYDGRTVKKLPKKHIHEKAKSKPTSNKLIEKNCFYFENALFFAIIWSEQKKIDKVFLVKQ